MLDSQDESLMGFVQQSHFVAFEAGVAVSVGVILEVAEVVFALGLVFAIQHRNMRCHFAVQQPRQKRAGAI